MRKHKFQVQDVVPVVAFVVILLFFSITSIKNGVVRMLTIQNLTNLISQVTQTIVIASGTLFVVSQGHIDMSVGVNLALSGVIGMWTAHATGIAFLFIPVSLLVGLLLGLYNGVIVSVFKVPSFMQTLAMLIGIRGLVNFIQVKIQTQRLPDALSFMTIPAVKIIMFFVILAIMAYIFEFTNMGRYSRAIGENETAAKFAGIPVRKMKIFAFLLSGLMAGVGAIFSVINLEATTQMMGVFLEMRVIMAIFLGGVLTKGGSSGKFYKILLGSFSIEIIVNGLALNGWGTSYMSQGVQGLLLLAILIITQLAQKRYERQ